MDQKEKFLEDNPNAMYLEANDLKGLTAYLRKLKWIDPRDSVTSAASAGDGNMNCTLRVKTSVESLVVKQSRPWIEKFIHIQAPPNRTLIEGRFYEVVKSYPRVCGMMPGLIGIDRHSRVLAMEDLGVSKDFTGLYSGDRIQVTELDQLLTFLLSLHGISPARNQELTNRAMRELNHEYIFHIPLKADNGIDLDKITPGLQKAAQEFKKDELFVNGVASLGSTYLSDQGQSLLHGDFYPGSWLRTPKGVRVIDPEFCYIGPGELDVGFMLAHLALSKQPNGSWKRVLAGYSAHLPLNSELTLQFAGVEIMRRLLGVARVADQLSLEEKVSLLQLARNWVVSPERGLGC